jgi:hypothetical protein
MEVVYLMLLMAVVSVFWLVIGLLIGLYIG